MELNARLASEIVGVLWRNLCESVQLMPPVLREVVSAVQQCEADHCPQKNDVEILRETFGYVIVMVGLECELWRVYENDLVNDYGTEFNYLLIKKVQEGLYKLLVNQAFPDSQAHTHFNTLIKNLQ